MTEKQEKPALTVSEAGRLGGLKTAQRHGTEFYQHIGKLGGAKVRKLIQAGRAQEAEEVEE